jgi:hypothetical protein
MTTEVPASEQSASQVPKEDPKEPSPDMLRQQRELALSAIYRRLTDAEEVKSFSVIERRIAEGMSIRSDRVADMRRGTNDFPPERVNAFREAFGVPDDPIPFELFGPGWKSVVGVDLSKVPCTSVSAQLTVKAGLNANDKKSLVSLRRASLAKVFKTLTGKAVLRQLGEAGDLLANSSGMRAKMILSVVSAGSHLTKEGLEKLRPAFKEAGCESLLLLWGKSWRRHKGTAETELGVNAEGIETNQNGMSAELREKLKLTREWYLRVAFRQLEGKLPPRLFSQVLTRLAEVFEMKATTLSGIAYGWGNAAADVIQRIKSKLPMNGMFHEPEILGKNWHDYLEVMHSRMQQSQAKAGTA